MTPERMVLLRLLNLSLLRFQWIADMFRKLVVRRLMTGKDTAALKLRREIVFSPNAVEINDTIDTGRDGISANSALYRCRRVTGAHMASSRYFQSQELEPMHTGWIT